jgi:hypothetical protein
VTKIIYLILIIWSHLKLELSMSLLFNELAIGEKGGEPNLAKPRVTSYQLLVTPTVFFPHAVFSPRSLVVGY